ncbi:MAG: DUF418 domain-containing protein, partial [Phycisphaerales bacterium]|nr:DUF418 domain-containing protein [Phycisphaerales bacterium]
MSAFQQPKAHPYPMVPAERIHTLDVLRGMALLGMILVHFHIHSLELGGVDDLVRTAIWRLVETKSHGIFALLFGAGFALQLRRAEARGAPLGWLYLRRLAVLALFGFAAHALFGFNVLLSYAVWGVPLLLIRRWSTGALIATAILSAISMALYSLITETYSTATLGADAADAAMQARQETRMQVNEALKAAAAQSDYSQLVAARLRHMAWFYTQPFFFLPGPTMALFIAGLLAVRHRIFEQPLAHRRTILAMMAFGLISWLAANWLPPVFWLLGLLRDQWLAFTYIGAVLLLLARFPLWIERLWPIGQVGRMALTNYLLQIAVLDLLFSGYGLHLPEIRPLAVPLATALLFGAEMAMSAAWLARFRFGPAEWAWRSLTYGQAQPMRR